MAQTGSLNGSLPGLASSSSYGSVPSSLQNILSKLPDKKKKSNHYIVFGYKVDLTTFIMIIILSFLFVMVLLYIIYILMKNRTFRKK